MSEPFLAQIVMFGGNFAPQGWAMCDGQLLAISQNSALFSILGTTYGGDGETTFGLPDLRGRVPMHAGTGSGLTTRDLGERSGAELHSLTTNEGPSHSHQVAVSTLHGDSSTPVDNKLAVSSTGAGQFSATADGTMAADFVQTSGAGAGHNNVQPYQAVNFIIALTGTFPSE